MVDRIMKLVEAMSEAHEVLMLGDQIANIADSEDTDPKVSIPVYSCELI
jgi:hypothetical protein